MSKKLTVVLTAAAMSLFITGCKTALEHSTDVKAARGAGEKVSVGTVQREIRVGMSSADVVGVLGSPNMVTTDDQRRENWVYDKISTEKVFSVDSGGVSALVLGGAAVGGGIAGGGLGAGYSSAAGASSTSQRTLTIIIKFGKDTRVRDFAYRYSSF